MGCGDGAGGAKECPPSGSQVPGAGPRGTPVALPVSTRTVRAQALAPSHAPVTPNCLSFFTRCRQLLILVTLPLCPLCQDGTHSFPLRLTPPHPGLTGGTLTPIPPQPARQGASLGLSLCPGARSPVPGPGLLPRAGPQSGLCPPPGHETQPDHSRLWAKFPEIPSRSPRPLRPPRPPPRPALAPFPRAGSRLCPSYPEPLPLHLRAFVLAVLSARYPPPHLRPLQPGTAFPPPPSPIPAGTRTWGPTCLPSPGTTSLLHRLVPVPRAVSTWSQGPAACAA